MKRVIIYGVGKFCEKYENAIKKEFEIVGYVDKKKGEEKHNNKYIVSNIDDCLEAYDKVIIMVGDINVVFEIVKELLAHGVIETKILIGKLYYEYSDCIESHVISDGKLKIWCEGKQYLLSSEEEYCQVMKKVCIPLLKRKSSILEKELEKTYEKLLYLEWLGENPLSHDHNIDIYYRFPKWGIFDWGENAILNSRAIYQFNKPSVLELGCADAFYFFKFYSFIDGIRYMGCDMDVEKIEWAREHYNKSNATFIVCDFVNEMPYMQGLERFTNILWNDSIQMFDEQEKDLIMNNIKNRLAENGILSGSASIAREDELITWKYCKYPFRTREQVEKFLSKYFKNVFVYTDNGMKSRALFMASDSELPFNNY